MMEDTFTAAPGFCSDCGSILPLLREKGNVSCYACSRTCAPEGSNKHILIHKEIYVSFSVFGDMEVKYTIHFNTIQDRASNMSQTKDKKDQPEGPVVERRCPACGNDKMSYATLQLRSADEGQTVFYTCTRCK